MKLIYVMMQEECVHIAASATAHIDFKSEISTVARQVHDRQPAREH
jgi:hypothetical protein